MVAGDPGAFLYGTGPAPIPDLRTNIKKRPARAGPSNIQHQFSLVLAQVATEALDALAGIFQVRRLGRIGNAERRSKPECRTLHDSDAFALQELGDEVLVIAEHLARGRSLADGAGAG